MLLYNFLWVLLTGVTNYGSMMLSFLLRHTFRIDFLKIGHCVFHVFKFIYCLEYVYKYGCSVEVKIRSFMQLFRMSLLILGALFHKQIFISWRKLKIQYMCHL